MFCRKCGKEIKDGAVFCEFCGASQAAPVPDAQMAEGEAPKKRRKQKGKKKGKIGTIVAVLFVGLAILAFVGSPKDSDSEDRGFESLRAGQWLKALKSLIINGFGALFCFKPCCKNSEKNA